MKKKIDISWKVVNKPTPGLCEEKTKPYIQFEPVQRRAWLAYIDKNSTTDVKQFFLCLNKSLAQLYLVF